MDRVQLENLENWATNRELFKNDPLSEIPRKARYLLADVRELYRSVDSWNLEIRNTKKIKPKPRLNLFLTVEINSQTKFNKVEHVRPRTTRIKSSLYHIENVGLLDKLKSNFSRIEYGGKRYYQPLVAYPHDKRISIFKPIRKYYETKGVFLIPSMYGTKYLEATWTYTVKRLEK